MNLLQTDNTRAVVLSSREYFQRLYAILEASVREENGEENWDKGADEESGRFTKDYPHPVLWYDGIKGEDLDVYHQRYGGSTSRPKGGRDGDHKGTGGLRDVSPRPITSRDEGMVGPEGKEKRTMKEVESRTSHPSSRDSPLIGRRPMLSTAAHHHNSTASSNISEGLGAGNMVLAGSGTCAAPEVEPGNIPSHLTTPSRPTQYTPCETTRQEGTGDGLWTPAPETNQPGFLLGLPSQLVISQGGYIQKEVDTPQSEYASPLLQPPSQHTQEGPLPSMDSEAKRHDLMKEDAPAEEDGAIGSGLGEALGSCEGSGKPSGIRPDDFVRVLWEQLPGVQTTKAPCQAAGSEAGSTSGALPPEFQVVPTSEAFPWGFVGGQEAAISALELLLREARRRSPEGYTVRALELAVLVLQQPAVCIKTVASAPLAENSSTGMLEMGNTTTVPSHPEVVGVAGFVWGLLARAKEAEKHHTG
ncbi:unnamed protein product [Discosporangium mesarthrocarpum]